MYREVNPRILSPEEAAQYAGFEWAHPIPSTDSSPDPMASWGLVRIISYGQLLRVNHNFDLVYSSMEHDTDFSTVHFGNNLGSGLGNNRIKPQAGAPFSFDQIDRVNQIGHGVKTLQGGLIELDTARQIQELGDNFLLNLRYLSEFNPTAERLAQIGVIEKLISTLVGQNLPETILKSAVVLKDLGVAEMILMVPGPRYCKVGYLLEEFGGIPYTDPNRYTANVF